MARVPNIFHLIFGLVPDFGGRPFSLVHYLAITSCLETNKPDRINLYYSYEPSGPWWEKARSLVTVVKVEAPSRIFGIPVTHFAHKADILRLKILHEHGGVYLDSDILCLRNLSELRQFGVVMGEENLVGLGNAVILAEPHSAFIQDWIDSYRSYDPTKWNAHSVVLPKKLAALDPARIHIVDHRRFFWPMWHRETFKQFFDGSGTDFCAESFCVHLWESVTWDLLETVTPEFLRDGQSEFCKLARRFLDL